jgi:hypothetical protein
MSVHKPRLVIGKSYRKIIVGRTLKAINTWILIDIRKHGFQLVFSHSYAALFAYQRSTDVAARTRIMVFR